MHATINQANVKKICFFGPESTGKTTMARHLARVYNTVFVPEVARELVSSNAFTLEDIVAIGKAQTQRIIDMTRYAKTILLCDSDLITTQLYSKIYLNQVPDVLFQLEQQVSYDLYFLFHIDVPWIDDGLRDLGDRRHEIFSMFREELEKRKISYINVQGDWKQREQIIRSHIDQLLIF